MFHEVWCRRATDPLGYPNSFSTVRHWADQTRFRFRPRPRRCTDSRPIYTDNIRKMSTSKFEAEIDVELIQSHSPPIPPSKLTPTIQPTTYFPSPLGAMPITSWHVVSTPPVHQTPQNPTIYERLPSRLCPQTLHWPDYLDDKDLQARFRVSRSPRPRLYRSTSELPVPCRPELRRTLSYFRTI